MIYLMVVLVSFINFTSGNKNNVCKSYEDYYTIDRNPRCWYNFAADVTVPELIRLSGYPVIEYEVTTADGYILTMFRIPGTRNPVFLQHGLLSTSANFLSIGNDSLAFILARQGYDVWLGNVRGNRYAEKHINLTVADSKFWDYSEDEIGAYDISAELNFITTKRKRKIIYIGHSMGATVGIIYSLLFPKEAREMIKLFIFLAPGGTLSNIVSPIRIVQPFFNRMLELMNRSGTIRLFSQYEVMRSFVTNFCMASPLMLKTCMEMYHLFYGIRNQTPPEAVPVHFHENPGGASFKLFNHVLGLIRNDLRRYDYGKKNLEIYGSVLPPKYELSSVEIPSYVVYAVGDWTVSPKDAWRFYESLPHSVRLGIHEVSVRNFNHIDFMFGKNVKSILYDHLLNVIKNF